jgi:hypothetical protein
MPLQKYYIDGLELTLHESNFLVEVRHSESVVRDAEHSVTELPEWIFSPRLAIWLMADGETIRVRALQGEAVRKEMTERWGAGAIGKRAEVA